MRRMTSYNLWPAVLCFPLGALAAVVGRYALTLPVVYDGLLSRFKVLRGPFLIDRIEGSVQFLVWSCAGVAAIFLVCSFVGLLVKRSWALSVVRKGYIAAYVLFAIFLQVVFRSTDVAMSRNLVINSVATNPVIVFFWRCHLLWPAAFAVLALALLHLLSWRRVVISYYTGVSDDSPAVGDRILENARTHGDDPMFRKSMWSSAGLHILIIIVVPWLLSLRGCVEDYRIQKGSGTPEVGAPPPLVKIVKAKKKKKKYMLNPQSAISFHVPDLDESMVGKQVEEMTQNTYKADPSRVLSSMGTGGSGKLGAGGGKTGGWPDGSENAKFRFIRLEYNGPGWDDGMDAVSRADRNFLDEFRKLTGFKTAEASESHPIASLGKYKKGFAPPFVYMTGSGEINVSAGDMKVLREYLLDGGMLFADCGSPQWDRNFRGFIQTVFPGEGLRVIADDDPIFQIPFVFPNGAPPLWHHGGMRAMGIKNKGRWVVFYHPGDINDAWKTGHSGMDAELTKGAMEMGINIVYYSFTHYLEITRKYRK